MRPSPLLTSTDELGDDVNVTDDSTAKMAKKSRAKDGREHDRSGKTIANAEIVTRTQ